MFLAVKMREHSPPPDLCQATVVVIPKPGKPPENCGSYRPISLLNVETKVLASILATRLLMVITSLVHKDQSCFMPKRDTHLNRLANWLDTAEGCGVHHLLLSLDAEKAFDTVHWPFMRLVLVKLGFGHNFRTWVDILYTNPRARVRVNGVKSAGFPIQQRTRQGCPLSSLLFTLVLESLACLIRTHPDLTGFQDSKGRLLDKRISLYADNTYCI